MEEIFHRLRATLLADDQVALAVLFGSRARGRARPDSDVDLAVQLMAAPAAELRPLLRRRWQAELAVPLDLIFVDQAPALLRLEIARAGIVWCQRRPHGWANFKAQAMIDWGDFAYTARQQATIALGRLRDRVRRGPA